MRHNPDYALTDEEAVKALIREHPWVSFTSFVPRTGLVASHYPVILDEDADGIVLLSHVGRPDERLHELGAHEVLVMVYGPQGYLSPGWYQVSPAVPTWNFAVVHAYGVPEILSDEENLAVLDRLVAHFESVLPEPFLMERTQDNADYARRIVGGTVGFRLRVTRFEGKEKMSQDKPVEVVDRVIAHLRQPGPYANAALADRMEHVRNAPAQPDSSSTDSPSPDRQENA